MASKGISALALALALAACGGGGGGSPSQGGGTGGSGSSSGGTPTPTPGVSYTKFADLTGNQSFKSACGGLFGPTEAFDAFGFGRPGTPEGTLAIDYTAATQNWTLAGKTFYGNPLSYTFTPAMIQPNPPTDATYYRLDSTNSSSPRFYLSARKLGGMTPEYVRGALLTYRDGTGQPEYRYCVFGVPTTLADTRPTSTVAYGSFAVGGNAFVAGGTFTQYDLSESTATITANPTSGEIPVQLKLIGRAYTPTGLSDTRVDLGTFRGTATIDGSTQSFNAAFTDADRALSAPANFGGWFFGPQGKEIGFGYSIKAYNADGSQLTAAGAVTARR